MGEHHTTMDEFIDDLYGDGAHAFLQERHRFRWAANEAVAKAITDAVPEAVLAPYNDVIPQTFAEDGDVPLPFHSVEDDNGVPLIVHNTGARNIPCGVVLSWRSYLELLHQAGRVPAESMPDAEQMLGAKAWGAACGAQMESLRKNARMAGE